MATAVSTDTSWGDFLADGRAARVALICLGVWLNAADSLVTTTIMPSIGRELGGYAYFSWATAAYMVGAILSGATAAGLSARMGLRRAMVAAGLLTAVGCAMSALARGMLAAGGGTTRCRGWARAGSSAPATPRSARSSRPGTWRASSA